MVCHASCLGVFLLRYWGCESLIHRFMHQQSSCRSLNTRCSLVETAWFQLYCSNIAIHSSMWSLSVHACKSANICLHTTIGITLMCDETAQMLINSHKCLSQILLLTVIVNFIGRTTINFPLVTLHLLSPGCCYMDGNHLLHRYTGQWVFDLHLVFLLLHIK